MKVNNPAPFSIFSDVISLTINRRLSPIPTLVLSPRIDLKLVLTAQELGVGVEKELSLLIVLNNEQACKLINNIINIIFSNFNFIKNNP